MAKPRWRQATWAFLIFNLLMVAFLWLMLSPEVWLDSSCGQLPDGSSRTACAMGAGLGGAFVLVLGVVVSIILWPIGLIAIAIAWSKGRRVKDGHAPRPIGPPRPRITRTHIGTDADSVLAAAASNAAELQTAGLSLVEAVWSTKPTPEDAGPFRLSVAFGKPGVRFGRLWPDDEDVKEAVLAHVRAAAEQPAPLDDG